MKTQCRLESMLDVSQCFQCAVGNDVNSQNLYSIQKLSTKPT